MDQDSVVYKQEYYQHVYMVVHHFWLAMLFLFFKMPSRQREPNNEGNTSKVERTSQNFPAFRTVIPNKSGRLLVKVIEAMGGGGGGGGRGGGRHLPVLINKK